MQLVLILLYLKLDDLYEEHEFGNGGNNDLADINIKMNDTAGDNKVIGNGTAPVDGYGLGNSGSSE